MKKTIEYKIPNSRYSLDDSEGKTSTIEYDGPDVLVCWIINNEGDDEARVVDSFAKEDEPERPTPLNYTRVEIDARESDENALRIGMLYGGFPEQQQIEVEIPIDILPNKVIADPTHPREIFSNPKALFAYSVENSEWAPLEYRTGNTTERTDESIKDIRMDSLSGSDSSIPGDLPESLKQEWYDFRQTLRDLPELTKDIPNEYIQFPTAPDEANDIDNWPEGTVMRLADRTPEIQKIIDECTPDIIK